MLYMVQGYIFISIYNFIRFKNNELNHLFFKSVVSSYILKSLFDFLFTYTMDTGGKFIRLFHIAEGSIGYIILLFVFSAILACIIAFITQSHKFNDMLLKLNIKRTTNPNMWEDVIRPDCWLMVYLKNSSNVYYGQCKYNEEFARKPLVTLEHYQVMDYDGNIIEDYVQNSNHVVVIDTEDVERVEVVYQ